jgi:tRNA threonylcarbamoyladenosine biosynthesis protein TsaB
VILALDTSNEQASVALAAVGQVQAEYSWLAQRNHSRQLTAAIRHLLRLLDLSPSRLSAVCVAIGPGSFSGVRVGISEGKGIAMGLGIPLVGVSTLDVIGLQSSLCGGRVLVVTQAGRGQVFLARMKERTRRGSARATTAWLTSTRLPRRQAAPTWWQETPRRAWRESCRRRESG